MGPAGGRPTPRLCCGTGEGLDLPHLGTKGVCVSIRSANTADGEDGLWDSGK